MANATDVLRIFSRFHKRTVVLSSGAISGYGDAGSAWGSNSPYDAFGGIVPEAAALFGRFTSPPSADRRAQINAVFVAGKRDGWLAKLDAMYVMAAADSQAARLNWVQTLYTLTEVAAPTFTVDRGYTGNGTSSYLDTGFDPSLGTGMQQQDSAHISSYVLNDVASDTAIDIGQASAAMTYIRSRRAGTNVMRGQISQASASDFALSPVTSVGHSMASRLSASGISGYKDGVLLGFSSVASVPLSSATFNLLRGNAANYSTRQIAAATIGAGLSGAEVLSMRAALLTYLQAVGAA